METIALYLKCAVALMIGLSAHTINKYVDIDKNAVGKIFFFDFLKSKPMPHVLNLICCVLWMLVLPDVVRALPTISIPFLGIVNNPYIANVFHIVACAVIGFGNSSFMLTVFKIGVKYGVEKIEKVANVKADEAPKP